MHRSRAYAVLIDTPAEDAGRAVDFWSAALGATPRSDPGYEQFTELRGALNGLVAAVQSLQSPGDAPRYHLDIETDDVEAETARLIALGATEEARWEACRILRAPGGHFLCVLPVETDPDYFASHSTEWPSADGDGDGQGEDAQRREA